MIGLTGAKIIAVEPTAEAMDKAVNERTAAVFLFPSTLYEEGIPSCEEIIPVLKSKRGDGGSRRGGTASAKIKSLVLYKRTGSGFVHIQRRKTKISRDRRVRG